ncbi:HCP-like protein [Collybia nuda]|uniref:HCP-like protein n=1 Tax=Collybia nuda TaxID=64659 RepID=A0A9P5XTW3_9AGAR|nr:HCP-like protein [Collybia nuda]
MVGGGTLVYPEEDHHTPQYGLSHETERSSIVSHDEPVNEYASPDSIGFSPQSHAHPQRPWQPQSGEYNPLYAAASNVLGMGPPPGPPLVSSAHLPITNNPGNYSSFANSQISLSSSHSAPYSGPSSHASYQPSINSYSSQNSVGSYPGEAESRPAIQRAGTSASVNLTSHKSKAVDLSAPPFTKEYIDQYRQRIKADPDPEAHFLYAKYLIDAAKNIRANAKDQRSAKKYSEILIGESLKVIRRLATQGEAYDEAQFFLANCYGTGALGLQVDHERAYHLYLQAAKQNHAPASYRVAVCNEIGAGTRRELPRAAAFYRKAASLGDTPAMYKLGMILLNGSLGEQKNHREAINWLKRAAEQADDDNPHALHELGLLHEIPNSPLVVFDPVYAKNLFTQAAQLGYTPSQFKLGQCFEYGSLTCPVDPRRSIAWYTKAAEKGDSEAELALSGWYLTGSEGVLKQSDSEAYLWARRAANKGLSKAEYAVGYYAEVGIGIKQDVEFAKRWYMRAAAQGNKRAMNRLTEMKRMGNKRANVARPTRQQAKDECVIC